MPGRNLAKPFAIAGFILAEAYMLFTVLGPTSRETHLLPVPVPATEVVEPGTPVPLGAQVSRALISALLFWPLGAIAGTGLGLLASGLRGDFRQKDHRP